MSNKRDWVVTSGYTIGTKYLDDAMLLYESGLKHGVYIEVMPFRSFGTWRANANYKGSLVLAALKRHPAANIVWIDADALILKYPILFDDFPADIGVYFAPWPLGSDKKSCSNGTIFFRNCPEVLAFVEKWAKWSLANPIVSQQKYFGDCLLNGDINWEELPPEYCMVVAPDPVPVNFKPHIIKPGPIRDDISIEDVVIMHTWAGARYGGSTKSGVIDGKKRRK